MYRFAPKSLVLSLIVAGFLGASASTARAGEDEDMALALGKKIVVAAHFSGEKHSLADYSTRDNTLNIEMNWRGGVLGTAYTSNIKVKFKSVGGKVKIDSIDYKDNAYIKPSRPNIDRFIRDFNDE